MYKKVLALVATALIASTVTVAASAVVNFNDIYESFAEKDIISLVEKGIIQGRGDGTFDPKASVTREEEAAIINRLITYLDGIRKEDAALLTKKLEELEKLAKDQNTVYVPVTTPAPPQQPNTDNPSDYVLMEDLSFYPGAGGEGIDGWNVGFNIDHEKLPYSKIQSITVRLLAANGTTLGSRTATGAQITKLAGDDETYGGTDGKLSAVLITRAEDATNDYWNSTPYDGTAPEGASVTIVTTDGKAYTVSRNI